MSDLDIAAVTADLTRDEGFRLFVYDDATGRAIKPGSTLVGHPTVGIGRALDTRGLTGPEVGILLADDIRDSDTALTGKCAWYPGLDTVRKRVVVELVFNMGLEHLLGFHNMIEAIEQEDWTRAAAEMICSAWFKQVGDRARRLATLMRTGEDNG